MIFLAILGIFSEQKQTIVPTFSNGINHFNLFGFLLFGQTPTLNFTLQANLEEVYNLKEFVPITFLIHQTELVWANL